MGWPGSGEAGPELGNRPTRRREGGIPSSERNTRAGARPASGLSRGLHPLVPESGREP